jgi:enoyl-CoA hydratase
MIQIDEGDGISILQMDDGKANAMDLEFCEIMTARLGELGSGPTPAIVLTGKRRIFSAGVDLLRLLEGGPPYVRKFLPALSTMLAAVFSFPKPVVAAINGHAIAGGCLLACAADRRLMSHDAGRIGVTELRVGVAFPTAAIEILRWAVGQQLEQLIFSAETYAPPQALERGLIHDVVESDDLLPRAVSCAKALAALPPAAFRLTKSQTRAPALERIQADLTRMEVEEIWTGADTLARVRDHVRRTLGKG